MLLPETGVAALRFGLVARPEKHENLCLYQGLLTFSLRDGFFA